MLSNIIAICNQKGGVGKTTTAINLAAALAGAGKKILIIDLDPQGNASTGLGIDYANRDKSIYEVLASSIAFDESVSKTNLENLFIIPSNVELSGIEPELANESDKAFVLKSLINNSNSIKTFDYIFIDCPPALSLLTLNALVSANSVLIPMQCEYYALEGLSDLVNTIKKVKKHLNPQIEIEGLLRTLFDKRNTLGKQVSDQLSAHFGNKVYTTIIPRNIRLAEAPSHGKAVLFYDKSSKGAKAYLELADEILERKKYGAK